MGLTHLIGVEESLSRWHSNPTYSGFVRQTLPGSGVATEERIKTERKDGERKKPKRFDSTPAGSALEPRNGLWDEEPAVLRAATGGKRWATLQGAHC